MHTEPEQPPPTTRGPQQRNNMTVSDVTHRGSDDDVPLDTHSDAEPDVTFVLTREQAQQVDRFREELYVCETDTERYELCVHKRDDLLAQNDTLHILFAICEQAMSAGCAEYKQWREIKTKARKPLPSRAKDDNAVQWDRFFDVATDGSRHLSALKEVVRCWGRDVVQHYQWASKGEKYWNQLRATARKVHEWDKAAAGLTWSMVKRSQTKQRRYITDSVNPIAQSDLENLRAWSCEDPPPYKRLAVEDLPDGFGFDKFRLIVRKEYATELPNDIEGTSSMESLGLLEADHADTAALPRPHDAIVAVPQGPTAFEQTCRDADGDVVEEVVNAFLTELANGTIHAGHEHPSADSAPDTSSTPVRTPPVPRTPENTYGSTVRTLRERPQVSYREPSDRGGAKPKQSRSTQVKTPQIPSRCCPIEVPSKLLSALDNPCLFHLEVVEQLSPLLGVLCRRHLELLAKQTSLIAAQRDALSLGIPSMLQSGVHTPVRRRTSLPDITQHISKRPRLEEPLPLPSPNSTRSRRSGDRPMHDRIADDAFRRQVLAELQEALATPSLGTRGTETNELICKLLEKAEQPNTEARRGVVEAFFCTGDEAARLVESGPDDAPIITEGQQQFRWSIGNRPIVQLFRRLGPIDKSVSVQIPSRSSTVDSFDVRKLSEVRKRFLDQKPAADPWNILDLHSPLPSILPNFLVGENCQLLSQVRDTVLMEGSAERVAASPEDWNEWKNVLEWVLLSEGGNNTGPHVDSNGLSTWATEQEGSVGWAWMSHPTKEEREKWMADPDSSTGGRWRYVVLRPDQSFYMPSGTIHFVFRKRQPQTQTFALGGHILQWSGVERWMQAMFDQMRNPAITNEDVKWSAPKLVRVVAKLVTARVKEGGVEELGGEATVQRFFASVKVRSS